MASAQPAGQSLRFSDASTMDGRVTLQVPAHLANGMWELYSPDGSRIAHGACETRLSLELPQVRGTYVFKAHGAGAPWVQRVVRR